jgi:hypothetical protein
MHLVPAQTFASGDLIDYADQLPPHRRELIERHYAAVAAYRAQPYGGRVLLLRAEAQPLLAPVDSAACWLALVPPECLSVHTVGGSHEGMFHAPFVEDLAEHVRAALGEQ